MASGSSVPQWPMLLLAQDPADPLHDVVRGAAGFLVDQQKSVLQSVSPRCGGFVGSGSARGGWRPAQCLAQGCEPASGPPRSRPRPRSRRRCGGRRRRGARAICSTSTSPRLRSDTLACRPRVRGAGPPPRRRRSSAASRSGPRSRRGRRRRARTSRVEERGRDAAASRELERLQHLAEQPDAGQRRRSRRATRDDFRLRAGPHQRAAASKARAVALEKRKPPVSVTSVR